MTTLGAPPAGLRALDRGGSRVFFDEEIAEAALVAGLDEPWRFVRARPPGPGTGRGPRAVLDLPGGPRVIVKQYLRGGALARLNPERYFHTGRFLRELEVSRRVRAAGLPAGEALGVVLRPARPFWRAWGVARYVEDAPDLARTFAGGLAPDEAQALGGATIRFVERLAAAGLFHRDLNLGNLLARRGPGGFELFVVDLDRARFSGRPLPAAARARMTARLVRSWRKVFGTAPPFLAAAPSA